eukprot:2456164-Prymnesium_polylepis.1
MDNLCDADQHPAWPCAPGARDAADSARPPCRAMRAAVIMAMFKLCDVPMPMAMRCRNRRFALLHVGPVRPAAPSARRSNVPCCVPW